MRCSYFWQPILHICYLLSAICYLLSDSAYKHAQRGGTNRVMLDLAMLMGVCKTFSPLYTGHNNSSLISNDLPNDQIVIHTIKRQCRSAALHNKSR